MPDQDSGLVPVGDGSTVVDLETGEVVQWGAALPTSRVGFLQQLAIEAKEQEDVWARQKRALNHAITRQVAAGEPRATDIGRTTIVADGKTKVAPAPNLMLAVQLELLTHDQAAQLALECVRDLSVDALPTAIAKLIPDLCEACGRVEGLKHPHDFVPSEYPVRQRDRVMVVLINERPRSGYAYTTVAPKRAAAVAS